MSLARTMAGLTGDTKFRQVGVHDHPTPIMDPWPGIRDMAFQAGVIPESHVGQLRMR